MLCKISSRIDNLGIAISSLSLDTCDTMEMTWRVEPEKTIAEATHWPSLLRVVFCYS